MKPTLSTAMLEALANGFAISVQQNDAGTICVQVKKPSADGGFVAMQYETASRSTIVRNGTAEEILAEITLRATDSLLSELRFRAAEAQ